MAMAMSVGGTNTNSCACQTMGGMTSTGGMMNGGGMMQGTGAMMNGTSNMNMAGMNGTMYGLTGQTVGQVRTAAFTAWVYSLPNPWILLGWVILLTLLAGILGAAGYGLYTLIRQVRTGNKSPVG